MMGQNMHTGKSTKSAQVTEVIKKTAGAAKGILQGVSADRHVSEETSRQSSSGA